MNYENYTPQPNNEIIKPKKRKRRFWLFIILLIIIPIAVVISSISIKTGYTFEKIFIDLKDAKNIHNNLPLSEKAPPKKDPNRDNILVLGIRGAHDPNGGLLSDVNLIISLKKDSKQAALISIPRDLYVAMPGLGRSERINFAYAYGYEQSGIAGGMYYAKQLFQNITYLHIDNVVVVNFEAFKEIIDAIDGIDVYLKRPFREDKQFADEMIIDLPKGLNHLDGNTALYYARSRFSTSDFDRMRRQQNIVETVADKIISLGVLSNPKKISDIIDSLGRNIRTTMDASSIASTIKIMKSINNENIIKKQLNTSENGLLYSVENGAYHLLPVGDNYDKIQEALNNLFE